MSGSPGRSVGRSVGRPAAPRGGRTTLGPGVCKFCVCGFTGVPPSPFLLWLSKTLEDVTGEARNDWEQSDGCTLINPPPIPQNNQEPRGLWHTGTLQAPRAKRLELQSATEVYHLVIQKPLVLCYNVPYQMWSSL